MHKDIKILNLLVDKDGILKIMDCSLASFFDLEHKDPMSRIVVMYLAATYNDVGIDLLSAWCILAELLARKSHYGGLLPLSPLSHAFHRTTPTLHARAMPSCPVKITTTAIFNRNAQQI